MCMRTVSLLFLIMVLAWLGPAGDPARAEDCPDFSFDCPELFSGDDFTFADLTEEKPLVVHVWAPDCPHCLVQMPYAAAFYNKKLDRDEVNYVSFSILGSEKEIRGYLDEHELTFPTLVGEDGEYSEDWEEEGWPTTYVFATGGVYIGWCDTTGPAYLTEMKELVECALAAGD